MVVYLLHINEVDHSIRMRKLPIIAIVDAHVLISITIIDVDVYWSVNHHISPHMSLQTVRSVSIRSMVVNLLYISQADHLNGPKNI